MLMLLGTILLIPDSSGYLVDLSIKIPTLETTIKRTNIMPAQPTHSWHSYWFFKKVKH